MRTILETVVKCYHEYPLAPSVSVKSFFIKKKRGEPALKALKIKMAMDNLNICYVNWCLCLHVSQ